MIRSQRAISILVTLGVVAAGLLLLQRTAEKELSELEPEVSAITGSGSVSTTLKEALAVAEVAAKSWEPDAVALNIMSTDIGDPDPVNAGDNGKRYAWAAEFSSPAHPGTMLFVDVISGTVFATEPDFSGEASVGTALPGSSALSLDSSDAISQTLGGILPDLEVGAEDSLDVGYHYLLEPDQSNKPILSVIGERQGNRTSVDFDASTGLYITNTAYVYAESGSILYSSNGGKTWQASNLIGKMVMTLASDPVSSTLAYAIIGESDGMDFYKSTDSGATWSKVSDLPAGVGEWVYNIHIADVPTETMILGGSDGVWKSSDAGLTWTEASNVPNGYVLRTGILAGASGDTLTASFSDHTGGIDQSSVYTTTDLTTWTHVVSGTYRIAEARDNEALALIDYKNAYTATTVEILTASGIVTESIPDRMLRMAGDLSPLSGSLAGTTVAIHRHSGGLWIEELTEDGVGALTVSPSGGLAMAGGYGMWRSTDGGDTWAPVLTSAQVLDPIALSAPPGTTRQKLGLGKISVIEFLDESHVIAGNPGFMEWRH